MNEAIQPKAARWQLWPIYQADTCSNTCFNRKMLKAWSNNIWMANTIFPFEIQCKEGKWLIVGTSKVLIRNQTLNHTSVGMSKASHTSRSFPVCSCCLVNVLLDDHKQWVLTLTTTLHHQWTISGAWGGIPALCCLSLERFWSQGSECKSHAII